MKKYIAIFLVSVFLYFSLFAQFSENQKSFVAGSVTDKISIIDNLQGESIDFALLGTSLQFCVDNAEILQGSPLLSELLVKTLNAFPDSASEEFFPLLKKTYVTFTEREITIPLLRVLSIVSFNDPSVIQDLYSLLRNEVKKDVSQRSNDFLLAVIEVLGSVKDSNLFNSLFPCLFLDLDNEIIVRITEILSNTIQDYKQDAIKVIENGVIKEKRAVFDLAEKNSLTDDFFKAEIAENTLSSTINLSEDGIALRKDSIDLQLDAMRVIKRTSWTRSSLLIATYFNQAQKQYEQSLLTREELIEIIDCITVLASFETGKALTDYLGILNDKTEMTGTFDEVLLLSVIRSIGKLGEKSAFDNLLFVILYQGYPESIINASKEALAKLNW